MDINKITRLAWDTDIVDVSRVELIRDEPKLGISLEVHHTVDARRLLSFRAATAAAVDAVFIQFAHSRPSILESSGSPVVGSSCCSSNLSMRPSSSSSSSPLIDEGAEGRLHPADARRWTIIWEDIDMECHPLRDRLTRNMRVPVSRIMVLTPLQPCVNAAISSILPIPRVHVELIGPLHSAGALVARLELLQTIKF